MRHQSNRPRWLLLAAVASLAACSGRGSFDVNKHPMLVNTVLDGILSRIRNEPQYDPNSGKPPPTTIAIDPTDPGQAVQTALEDTGTVWIFPARDGTQEMRVHVIHHAMGFDADGGFDIRVEVKAPYSVTSDGKPFNVDQSSASERLDAAFAAMVERLNGESPDQVKMNAGAEGEPVVTAVRELVPWLTAKPRSPWGR